MLIVVFLRCFVSLAVSGEVVLVGFGMAGRGAGEGPAQGAGELDGGERDRSGGQRGEGVSPRVLGGAPTALASCSQQGVLI